MFMHMKLCRRGSAILAKSYGLQCNKDREVKLKFKLLLIKYFYYSAALNLAKTDQVLCGETENVDVGLKRSVVALNILDPARCLFAVSNNLKINQLL